MPGSVSEFDACFQAYNSVLDVYFAKAFEYRARGQTLAITATASAHVVEADPIKDITDSWIGWAFVVTAAELTIGGDVFDPEQGHEIAELRPDGTKQVYLVCRPPNMRCFAALDNERTKLVVYAKEVRNEPES
jgi:hypothetical protein